MKIAGYAEELTSDHHPDRDDERARIEVAGGFVLDWDVPRVNGVLAVSRAIGDVQLKRLTFKLILVSRFSCHVKIFITKSKCLLEAKITTCT